jgi:hypothetical protein
MTPYDRSSLARLAGIVLLAMLLLDVMHLLPASPLIGWVGLGAVGYLVVWRVFLRKS